MNKFRFAAASLLLLAGCSTVVVPAGSPNAITQYHAYGDSITYGLDLTDAATQDYAALIADQYKLSLANHAISGTESCDLPTTQIFTNSDSPTLTVPTFSTILISTNDVNYKGPGPYEAIFDLCQQASIAWLALPVEDKVLATSSLVTTSGLGHLETTNHWNAWTTDAANSSVTFPVQLSAAGPVYAWYRIIDGNAGTFTWSVDGQPDGSTTTATTPLIATTYGSGNSLALLRLPSIPAGPHTITFTQTSAASAGMGIVAVGVPPATRTASFPHVLVGTTPRQLTGTTGGNCVQTQTICLEYSADITANVALIAGDGLNVQLFVSGQYMTGTTTDMYDVLHPNALGHMEIAHSITDVLNVTAP